MFITQNRRGWAEGSYRPGIWMHRVSLEDHRSPSLSPRERDFTTVVSIKVHNELNRGKILQNMER